MAAHEPVETLVALLRRTSRQMVDELIERLHAAGYADHTAAHHPLFENIDPEGTRLTVLASRTGLTHQAVGELIDALEQRGYVERFPDRSDARARLVRLTKKGRAAVRTAIAEIARIEAEWMAVWRQAGLRGNLRAALKAGLRTAPPRRVRRTHPRS
ncbi:MAG TPA: MarR family transcriptional regulator [Vicinamibacterales bacterium]|nr:MarR family transcriptional regulator [Vicinamibacterales bacterium]